MKDKREQEAKLRAAVETDPAKQQGFGEVWSDVAAAYQPIQRVSTSSTGCWSAVPAQASELFAIARDVVRYAEESSKPNAEATARVRGVEPAGRRAGRCTLPRRSSDSMETVVLTNYFIVLVEGARRG